MYLDPYPLQQGRLLEVADRDLLNQWYEPPIRVGIRYENLGIEYSIVFQTKCQFNDIGRLSAT